MKNSYKIAALIAAWLAYGIWEYYVQQWSATHAGEAVIRVDLIILLPGLIVLTCWMLLSIYRERNAYLHSKENH